MKKWSFLLAIMITLLYFNACGNEQNTELHSSLYTETYTVEQVIEYFNEVALHTEYSTGNGAHHNIRKWENKITYTLSGPATEEDLEFLYGLFEDLNEIDGFPGIYAAEENETAAVEIYFYNRHEFRDNMSQYIANEIADGAAVYWFYDDSNEIHTAKIGYRTDIKQHIRNSVILEEVVNALGLGDSTLREDSIVYEEYSLPQELSEMDWIILKLLYSPEMQSGMCQEECAEVIRKLYY